MSIKSKTTLACALALGLSIPAVAMAAGQTQDTTYHGQTAQERAQEQAQNRAQREREARQNKAVKERSAHERMEAEEDDGNFMDGNRPDAWILTKVKTKFATSGTVHATDINVDVENGVAHLRGTVGSSAERREAVRLAEETEGVTRVDASGLRMVPESEEDR